MKHVAAVVVVALAAGMASARVGGKTYHFGTMEARTNIAFESKAEIETIIGTTNQVSGTAAVDGEKVKIAVSVPVASLRTGIDVRDEHLRGEKWLDAAKFPSIDFTVTKDAMKKGEEFQLDGTFKMHGVEKELHVQVSVKEIPADLAAKAKLGAGDWIRVRGAFDVKLSDFGVKVPEAGANKVSDTLKISIDLFGTTEKPKDAKPMAESTTAKEAKAGDVKVAGDGTRYTFGTKPQLTNMTAMSKTELETVIASSGTIAGVAVTNMDKGMGKVKLSVPVKSLKTGIEMRDEHLRSADWLDAAKFPDIVFESSQAAKNVDGTWAVDGTFTMHGVAKPITAQVTVKAISAEVVKKANWGDKPGLSFKTTFKVKLSDHGIKMADWVASKVQDEWTITFDAVAIQE